jgi:Na+/proline symporter
MRISVLVFAAGVLVYSIKMEGTPIYELVSSAYQVPLVGAFVPLVFGLYWKRANTQGAVCAVVLGIGVWVVFMLTPALHEAFPQQLAGLLSAVFGMVAGSLAPQMVRNTRAPHHRVVGVE